MINMLIGLAGAIGVFGLTYAATRVLEWYYLKPWRNRK